MQLTNNQKKFLRSMGHNINPVVMIGQNGLSDTVMEEILISLEKHELLKIKIRTEKDNKQKVIEKIIQKTQSTLVQVIGNVLVIYRAFNEDPQIILPRK